MFAAAPWLIDARARTSRRWGSSRRSSTSTCRRRGCSCWRRSSSGVASALFLFAQAAGVRSRRRWRRRSWPCSSAPRAGHRPAVGAQGVGRVVAVGRAAHLEPDAVDDLRRLPAAAALRRARVGEAGGRPGALRDGQRAVRLRVGQRLADAASRRPSVVPTLPVEMGEPFWFCVLAFLLLFLVLLSLRVRLEQQRVADRRALPGLRTKS